MPILKQYIVEATLRVPVEDFDVHSAVDKLRGGKIILDGKELKRAEVELERLSSRRVKMHVGLVEGRKRQIRRMAEAVGLDVTRLVRTKNWRSLFEKVWG